MSHDIIFSVLDIHLHPGNDSLFEVWHGAGETEFCLTQPCHQSFLWLPTSDSYTEYASVRTRANCGLWFVLCWAASQNMAKCLKLYHHLGSVSQCGPRLSTMQRAFSP